MSLEIVDPMGTEHLKNHEMEFKKLKPNVLFTLGNRRFFIAVEQDSHNPTTWKVIELNPTETRMIIYGRRALTSELDFSDMNNLRVIERWNADNCVCPEDLLPSEINNPLISEEENYI